MGCAKLGPSPLRTLPESRRRSVFPPCTVQTGERRLLNTGTDYTTGSLEMISLRESMAKQAEEDLQSALKSYGDVFVVVGEAGAQACPPAGEELKESLLNLKRRLSAEASAGLITETEKLFEMELHK